MLRNELNFCNGELCIFYIRHTHTQTHKQWEKLMAFATHTHTHITHFGIDVGRQFLRVVVIQRNHLSHWHTLINITPSVALSASARLALHAGLTLILDLLHHVVRHVAASTATLAPVETIGVLFSDYLRNHIRLSYCVYYYGIYDLLIIL